VHAAIGERVGMKRNTLLTISAALFLLGVWTAMNVANPSPSHTSRAYDSPNPGPLFLFLFALVAAYKAFKATPTETASEERKSNGLKTIMNFLLGIGVVCVALLMIPVVFLASAFMGFMQRIGLVDRSPITLDKPDDRNSN
jgi:hypothetical protein